MGVPAPKSVVARFIAAAKFKAKKKVKSQDGGETTVYVYSERQVSNRNRDKADRVEKLRKGIKDLRAKVKKDLTCEDPHKRLTALAVALMDCTIERIGNHSSAEDGHFGVTGWTKAHTKVKGDSIILTYVGKSGVDHEKTVGPGPTLTALKKALKGKSGDDRILEDGDVGVDPEDVNAYLKEFDITAKDIRGFRANQEMCEALTEERKKGGKLPEEKKDREKKLKAEFKRALETVAEIVGHEASTLKSQYLVPNLQEAYEKDGTILKELNKKATKTQAEKEDDGAEDLVRPAPKAKPPRKDLQDHKLKHEDPDTSKEDRDLSLNYKRVATRYLRALEFNTQEEMDKYLEDHPDADRSNHSVKKTEEKGDPEEDPDKPSDEPKGDPEEEDPPNPKEDDGDSNSDGEGGGKDPPKPDGPKPPEDDGSQELGDIKKGLPPEAAKDLHKLHGKVTNGNPALGKEMVKAIQEESQRAKAEADKALDSGDFRSVSKLFGKDGFSEEKSKKDIDEAIRERDGIAKEIETVKGQLKKSRKAVQSAKSKRDRASEDLKEAQTVLETVQKQLQGANPDDDESVRSNLKKLQRKVEDLQAKAESSEEELKDAEADLARDQEASDGLKESRKELDEANQKIVAKVAKHHAALAAITRMTAPLARKRDEGEGFRHRSLDRFRALPPEAGDALGEKMESDLAELDRRIEASGTEVDPELKAQRDDLAGEVSAWKVSKHLRKDKGLTTGLVKALHKADPGSDYIFDLAEGPESPKYRKAVHNAMAALSDDDFVSTLESYAPERVKDMLDPLKSGTYVDDAKGGKKVALSQEQAAFLRQSVVNAILNDADAEGENAEEGPGSTKKPKSPGGGSSGDKRPWWLIQLLKMTGRKTMAFNRSTIPQNYRTVHTMSKQNKTVKKASAEGIRRVVATLDNMATLLQEHHASLGLHEKVAMDMAERCDTISDFLQKKGQFDASTIGKKVSGPLQNDPSQSFMSGHFTQEVNSNVEAKVESGTLTSNAVAHKADPKLASAISKAVKEATLRVLAEMEEGEKEEEKTEEKTEEKKASVKKASTPKKAEDGDEKKEDEKAEEDADEADDEANKVASVFGLFQ